MNMPQPVSKEIQNLMVKEYLSGGSAQVIAERYGLDRHTCLAAVRRSGNKVRLREESRRRHKVKRDYFDVIDTEKKAYWLGFVTADGCVSDGKLAFHLSVCDREHLGRFAFDIGSDAPIREISRRKDNGKIKRYSVLEICSKYLTSRLTELGVCPNKTLTAYPWEGPPKLMPHYWRGVIDGDGWICKPQKKYNDWQVGVCGTHRIVDGFCIFAKEVCGTNARPYRHKRKGKYINLWSITVGGFSMPRKLLIAVYYNSSIYLDRKKILASQLISDCRVNRR
jgi:hypothetical protein